MNSIANPSGSAHILQYSLIPGLIELKSGMGEKIVCRPANPEASKEEIRIGSSLCVDHLCGCK